MEEHDKTNEVITQLTNTVEKLRPMVSFKDKERLDLAYESFTFFANRPFGGNTELQMMREIGNIDRIVKENEI